MFLLPEKPCDLYVEGSLMKTSATGKFEMVTTPLGSGTFKYTLTLRDSRDYTKTRQHIVNGIVAGGNLTVDLRGLELASL